MTNRIILMAVLTSTLTYGCATTPDDTEKTEEAKQARSDLICVKEKKTGSLRPVKRCRPREESPIQKQNTQQDMRRIQRQAELLRTEI